LAVMVIESFRRGLVGQVRDLFNDRAHGEAPVQPSDNALLPRGSVAWRVHGDVTTMMVGGISGLLLEMLHPAALAGVWDHSNFRRDMLGRLRRTARFIAQTTYAERSEAEAAIARVNRIHSKVTGTIEDGSIYRADDPRLLSWIHVAGAISFLAAWIRYGEPAMSRRDQDAYFAEVADVARRLGADPVPDTRAAAERLIADFRPELRETDRSREVARIILNPPASGLRAMSAQKVMGQAAIDLLPSWARRMHGLSSPILARPAIDAATFGMASTLRWAFAAENRR
jgi:uncharacterized protein (DUF2236 family)